MTSAPSTLEMLLADCEAHGIRLLLAGDGGMTIDAPQYVLTPDRLARMKAHKGELLAILRRDQEARTSQVSGAAIQEAAQGQAGEPVFEPLGPDGWPVGSIDPDELTPCPNCGTFVQWESAADDLFGLTPGRWRCMTCDPSTTAWRLEEVAERIRRRSNRSNVTRQKG